MQIDSDNIDTDIDIDKFTLLVFLRNSENWVDILTHKMATTTWP